MRIAIWKTGHEIADTVADAIREGIPNAEVLYTGSGYKSADAHIGYGILRGTADIFRRSTKDGKPWLHVDRGYFSPGHYDGYYRISLCGTQQTSELDLIEPDYEVFERCGIKWETPTPLRPDAHTLIVPPTGYVADFFSECDWLASTEYNDGSRQIIRLKSDIVPLAEHLTNCLRVITFNSTVALEALRRGIPVYSDPNHSLVGAFQKTLDTPLHLDIESRAKLFAVAGRLQLTLQQMRDGELWPLLQMLLKCSSVGTDVKQSPPMSAPTV